MLQPKVIDINSRSQKKQDYHLGTLTPLVKQLPETWRFCACNGSKQPQGAEWQKHPLTIDSFVTAQSRGVFNDLWLYPSDGRDPFNVPIGWCKSIGLICGPASGGILMLDHDGRSCDRLIEKLSGASIAEALPKSPLVTSGLPGRYQIAYSVPEHFWDAISTKQLSTGVMGANGKPEMLEFRWHGAQSIVLGEHPDTGSYRWVHHPNDVAIAEAPLWVIEQMLEGENHQVTPEAKKAAPWVQLGAFNAPPIPLIECVAKVTRMALEGSFASGRNQMGYAIATDLIGVEQYLSSNGIQYEGTASGLFTQWCSDVNLDSDTPKGQPARIWKSAEKGSPTPSRPVDSIQKTLKWWQWKHQPTQQAQSFSTDNPVALGQTGNPQEISDVERLRLDLQLYDQETDPLKRILLENNLGKNYSLRGSRLADALKHINPNQEAEFSSIEEIIPDLFAQIEARSMSTDLPGYRTLFDDLDAMIQGFQPGDLIIVAARPSMGKTALMLQIAKNLSQFHEMSVLFFSLEMSKKQLMFRLLSSECEIPAQNLIAGRVSDPEWLKVSQAIGRINGIKLNINDSASLTVEMIEDSAKKMAKDKNSIGMIVIDYLQLLATDGDENRTIGLSKITRRLKVIARDLSVPVVALSQLSRSVEQRQDKRPVMSDLRDSGGIEQDADQVMMLYRDEYYNPNSMDRGLCEIIVRKNRNGPLGTVKLLFEPQYVKFKNLVKAG